MNNAELDYKLFKAAKSGNLAVAKDLIEKGANVCAVKPGGYTPLYKAVFHDHYDMANLFLEKGADVHASDSHGHTLLFYAVQNNNHEIAKLILEKEAGVNLTSEQGTALLRVAIENNNAGIVCLLFENGANANAANQQGTTPLWLAICGNKKEIIGLLLKNGANIDFTDRYFRAALSVAENDIKKMVITTAIFRDIEKPARNHTTEELSTMWDTCAKSTKSIGVKTALKSVFFNNKHAELNPDCWEKILKNLDIKSLKNVTNVATFFYKTATAHSIENSTNSNANIRSAGI